MNYQRRKFTLIFGVISTALIFLARLFYLQVVDTRWVEEARMIVESKESVAPPRGIIMDRNQKILADNIIAYHLKIYPTDFLRQSKNFDTLSFCKLLKINPEEFEERMKKALGSEENYLITSNLNKNTFEKNQNKLQQIPGLYFKELNHSMMVSVRASRFVYSDTLKLAEWLDLKPEFLAKKLRQAWKQPILLNNKRMFLSFIPVSEFKKIAEKLYLFPGFLVEPVLQRRYPASVAAQVLGYLSVVNPLDMENDRYYRLNDWIGVIGLEQTYEKNLRGEKGTFAYLRNAYSAKVKMIDKDQNEVAIPGENLELTLDSDLQAYGEYLMQHKTGSIVAIDPKTGEILAMVSAGVYDPNLLTGRDFTKNYQQLLINEQQTPLYNRAIKATYRPGSIFKLLQALIGLQEKVITKDTGIPCNTQWVGCHNHAWANNVAEAVQHSCNPYFYAVFKKLIQRNTNNSVFKEAANYMPTWSEYVQSFGLGLPLDFDMGGAFRGMVPDKNYYDQLYGNGRWAFSTIYSLAIGEGELLVTPLQMANFVAAIANRGYFYPPHFLRKKGENQSKDEVFLKKKITKIDPIHFEPIVEGMIRVVNQGTGRNAAIKGIQVAGKTGTVQTQSLKAQKQNLSPHLRDHGVFVAFAPADDPKIAISVYVEYSGFGATYAAPIASLMIEKYLKSEVENKKRENYYQKAIIQKNEPIVWQEDSY